jgi:hypothetical protein
VYTRVKLALDERVPAVTSWLMVWPSATGSPVLLLSPPSELLESATVVDPSLLLLESATVSVEPVLLVSAVSVVLVLESADTVPVTSAEVGLEEDSSLVSDAVDVDESSAEPDTDVLSSPQAMLDNTVASANLRAYRMCCVGSIKLTYLLTRKRDSLISRPAGASQRDSVYA